MTSSSELNTQSTRPVMLCFVWLTLFASSCCSQTPNDHATQSLVQMYHTAWTIRDGAPNNIITSAQTTDGYLWFGGDYGLFRFDGKSFERYHPSSGDPLRRDVVWALKATPDGGLWIGYPSTGISFLKNGHNRNFGAREGLTAGSISSFALDHEGTVWARGSLGLLRLDGSQWRAVGEEWNYQGPNPESLYVDRRGTLWVGTGTQLLFLRPAAHRFEVAANMADDSYAMTEAPDGTLWLALTQSSVVQAIAAPDGTLLHDSKKLAYKCDTPFFSSDGTLWLPTYGNGVYRLSWSGPASERAAHSPTRVEHYSEQNGLTSNFAYFPLEDREGSVWLLSGKGIDQFRPAALTNISVPANFNRVAIVSDGADGLFAASASVLHVLPGGVSAEKGPENVSCAYRDPHGVIWLGGDDGLWRSSPRGFVSVALPREIDPAMHTIQTITMDKSGGLWVSFIHTGFLRFYDGIWTHPQLLSASAHDPGNVSFTDDAGRLWFGLRRSRIEVLDGADVTRYGVDSGLDIDTVSAIYAHDGQMWVGGELGLEFLQQRRFQHLLLANNEPLEGVSGIVQTANGDLWLNQASGVVHIPSAEVRRAQAEPSYRAKFTLYNYLDGLVSSAHQVRPSPTVIQTGDGRLYFGTRTALAWIDPAHLAANVHPPPVVIHSIIADGKLMADPYDLRLPVHTSALQIDYTASSFLVPQRVRFRYKLEGFDKDWQDAGTRRQAFYSALPPGRYSFHVIACNNDGIWSDAAAGVDFRIPPSFLQTIWFKALCALAVVAMLGMLYRIRVQLVTNQMKTVLYERLGERERIARDLHDTFFQGIQGLLLRFNTATSQLRPDEPARVILEQALQQSDQVMLEGRELVLDLRTGNPESGSLSEAFSIVGAEICTDGNVDFKVVVHGEAKELHPIVFEEAYRVGKEALANAFQHSKARSIEAELNYEASGLRLCVRDDGVGVDSRVLVEGGRHNHWGLPGMRERAQKIGALLHIWSRKGAGTEIELHVPAAVAYRSDRAALPSRWLSLFTQKEGRRI